MVYRVFVLAASLLSTIGGCDVGPDGQLSLPGSTPPPVAQPQTPPPAPVDPNLQVRVAQAKADLTSVRADARASVRRTPANAKATAEVAALAQWLDQARAKGEAQEKLAASAAWNTARLDLERSEAAAVDNDPAVVAADHRLTEACVELADAQRAQDEERFHRESEQASARAAAVDQRQAERNVGGERFSAPGPGNTPLPGFSGGRPYARSSDRVPVRGYTRRDGTYVHSHTRSAPRR